MAIASKKGFLSGYLTGQAIRRGARGTPGSNGAWDAPAADFDALSFKAGLAAGLCGVGRMIPYGLPGESTGPAWDATLSEYIQVNESTHATSGEGYETVKFYRVNLG